jgi:glucokinase
MYLGIEIGGTKLQIGVGHGDGVLAGLWRGFVNVAEGPEGIRRQITSAVPELLTTANVKRSQLHGVGIGFGGPVDDATHTVIKSHQIEGWDNFPLADWIGDVVELPAILGNDADCAGLAEALFGAGKGLSPVFYITIGSGIGGGLIVNGEVYRGCGRGAAEIGHLQIAKDEQGNRSYTVEGLASGWAIAKWARTLASRGFDPDSPLFRLTVGKPERTNAILVAQAASEGDQLARVILHQTIVHLADAINCVITLLCPRRIIIGGGVSLMGEELLLGPLREEVARSVFGPFADCCDIVHAALGEEVVVHGALVVVRRKFGPR